MFRRGFSLSVAVLAVSLMLIGSAETSHAGKPTITKPCTQCHKAETGVVRGKKVSHSDKFKTLQIAVGKIVWVMKHNDRTKIIGAKDLGSIKKNKEIAVTFTGEESKETALNISVKQPYTVPQEKLASVEEIMKLVALGPKKGDYLLVDARPMPRYNEGHIPGAVAMPFAAFDRMHSTILPKEEDRLIIFYCGGTT